MRFIILLGFLSVTTSRADEEHVSYVQHPTGYSYGRVYTGGKSGGNALSFDASSPFPVVKQNSRKSKRPSSGLTSLQRSQIGTPNKDTLEPVFGSVFGEDQANHVRERPIISFGEPTHERFEFTPVFPERNEKKVVENNENPKSHAKAVENIDEIRLDVSSGKKKSSFSDVSKRGRVQKPNEYSDKVLPAKSTIKSKEKQMLKRKESKPNITFGGPTHERFEFSPVFSSPTNQPGQTFGSSNGFQLNRQTPHPQPVRQNVDQIQNLPPNQFKDQNPLVKTMCIDYICIHSPVPFGSHTDDI